MRPLFTVHAGEFLVGEYIEETFSSLKVWIPAKDTGIDLLVTDAGARHAISLQVKLSRDYRPPEATEYIPKVHAILGLTPPDSFYFLKFFNHAST